MSFPPPNPSTLITAPPQGLPREHAWLPHLAQSEHYSEIGLAYRLLFHYGNRLRTFGAKDEVWYCNEVTNLWQPWEGAFAYFTQNYLINDLEVEADILEGLGDMTNATTVRDHANRLRNRVSAVQGVAARAKLQDIDGDSYLQSIGHRARFDKPSDFFRDEPGDEITALDGRVKMTSDGPQILPAALPQDGFTRSLPWKIEDLFNGEPEMYLAGLDRFMPDEYARDFFTLRLGTNVLGKAFKSGVLIILHGTGRNGKTTAIRAPMIVLGEGYAKPQLTLDFFVTDKRKSHNTDHNTFAYGLDGRRCASHGAEIEKGAMLYESNLKNAILMQPMDQRKMRENERTILDLQASFYMCANHLPRVEVSDRATKRRFLVIEMGASVPEAGDGEENVTSGLKRDLKKDTATIVAEHDGPRLAGFQIRKACEYLRRTEMDTKTIHIPQSIRAATEQWLSKIDPIADFYQNYMRPDPHNEVSTAHIYAAYLSYYNEVLAQDGFNMPMSSNDVIDHIDRARFPATDRHYVKMNDGNTRKLQHYNARLLSTAQADAYSPYEEPYEAEFEGKLDLLLAEADVTEYDSADYWRIHDQAREAWPQTYFEQQYAEPVDIPAV